MQKIDLSWCEDRLKLLAKAEILEFVAKRQPINLMPDHDLVSYQGGREIDYVIRDKINLSNTYTRIFSFDMIDYGYDFDDGAGLHLPSDGDVAHFQVGVDRISYRDATIELIGKLYGGSYDMGSSNNPVVDIEFIGLRKHKKVGFYWRLVLDALHYDADSDYRMAFFIIFSSIERLVIDYYMDNIHAGLYPEFRGPLKYIALEDKLKVVARSLCMVDLKNIPLWASMFTVFQELTDRRNQIAHSLKGKDFRSADVDRVFWLFLVLHAFMHHDCRKMQDVIKHYKKR